jgi:transcriptional antiterminator NusG
LSAEIVPGVEPHWYVIEVAPNRERTVAAHLIARRFGIFIPETEEVLIRRGRKVDVARLMFTGYVFVFVWDMGRHLGRIESIPGVARIMRKPTSDSEAFGAPRIVSDYQIDQIRAVENTKRPLFAAIVEEVEPKKKKRRWRKSRKDAKELASELADERDNDIMLVRSWSPFQDSLMTLDSDGRNGALLNALGLSS